MIWLSPLAWLAVVVVAAPVIIHLLAHSRAERVPFPTLRFIQPTRLASIHRRALEDVWLLVVRAAILTAAVAAVAGPLLVTPGRRAVWNARVVRAIVTIPEISDLSRRSGEAAKADGFRVQRFESDSLPDGIHRAIVWLEASPPARREIEIAAPLTLGSIGEADVTAIPAAIGIRFERTGAPPSSRTIDGRPVMATDGIRVRRVTLDRTGTGVQEAANVRASTWPIDVVVAAADRKAIDAAVSAVLAERVWAPPADRRVRLIAVDDEESVKAASDSRPIELAWMADTASGIARDGDLQIEGSRTRSGLNTDPFARAPWLPLVTAADGGPIASAAASSDAPPRLLIAMRAAEAHRLITPILLRSIANNLERVDDPRTAEILAIPDSQLRLWTRPAGDVTSPRADTMDRDDRGWLWAAALGLLAIETWLRRRRPEVVDAGEVVETARVA